MLQMVRHVLPIAIVALAACGCNHADIKGIFMPTGPGVDTRFEQSCGMNKNLKAAGVEAQQDYAFYVATDPHIKDSHRNLDIFNDAFRNDGGASFGVILGDCVDVRDNFHTYLDALAYDPARHSCDHRLFHVLGNHDAFFNGWADFRESIGPSVYWFEVVFDGGKDLYVILDTATGTLGKSQSKWFRSFLSGNRKDYRHCVILTHTNFFYTDNSQVSSGNMPLEESFSLIDFLGQHKVSLVMQGHDHHREDLTYENVRYCVLGAIHDKIKHPEYLKINVNDEGLLLDWHVISE